MAADERSSYERGIDNATADAVLAWADTIGDEVLARRARAAHAGDPAAIAAVRHYWAHESPAYRDIKDLSREELRARYGPNSQDATALDPAPYARTTVVLTVLSEGPLTDEQCHDVGWLAWAIDEGPLVGHVEVTGHEDLTAAEMADALTLAGSDASFFDIGED